jgi:hypothetical protein
MNQTLRDSEMEHRSVPLSENTNPGALSLAAIEGLSCERIAS